MSYFDMSVCAVSPERKDDYIAHCRAFHAIAREMGALAVADNWEDNVPDGQFTDFRKAVKAEPGEIVAAGWVVWPDKATRDAAWEKMMQDERMTNMQMPFDGKRMIFGSFDGIVES